MRRQFCVCGGGSSLLMFARWLLIMSAALSGDAVHKGTKHNIVIRVIIDLPFSCCCTICTKKTVHIAFVVCTYCMFLWFTARIASSPYPGEGGTWRPGRSGGHIPGGVEPVTLRTRVRENSPRSPGYPLGWPLLPGGSQGVGWHFDCSGTNTNR